MNHFYDIEYNIKKVAVRLSEIAKPSVPISIKSQSVVYLSLYYELLPSIMNVSIKKYSANAK